MMLPNEQRNCDHHFGDSGMQTTCTKCNISRDLAMIIGKAVARRQLKEKPTS